MCLFAAGAISFVEGIVPAQSAAPPALAPASVAHGDPVQNAVRLVWKTPGGAASTGAVEVIGVDPVSLQALRSPDMTVERWTSFFAIRVVRSGSSQPVDQPPLWGSYRVAGEMIRFEPRFPMEPGTRYRAELNPIRLHEIARELTPSHGVAVGEPRNAISLTAEYSPPRKPAQPTTQVAEIYPTGNLLPENLLRFYVVFTAPMSRGEAYRRIKLLEAPTGKPVDSAFLELDEELWSPDGTRFTLLFDPGRVKHGLKPREELGPVLKAGESYFLVIDNEWPDATGNPLKAGFRKSFRAGQADLSSPDPITWSIHSPLARSRDPLTIHFPEPLDRALVERLISVRDAEATIVPGQVSVESAETQWRFTPVSPWRGGDYRLVVGTELEDVAGNSVARPFEVDVAGPISGRVTTKTVELPFRIGPIAD